MVVTCSECGTEFEGVRASATMCSPRCRQRASRRARKETRDEQTGKVVQLARRHTVTPGASPRRGASAEPRGALSVETQVRAELGEGGDTALGQAALLIARRLDDQVDASGSAVASLVARLEKLMDAILSSRVVEEVESDETNPITILQRRAEERMHGAGIGA